MADVSEMDWSHYLLARQHITDFRCEWASELVGSKVLEIGPGIDAWPEAHTLGLDAACTYQRDITKHTGLPGSTYDVVIAMEVLEHTTDPFLGVREIRRLLKNGGLLLASAPWNFRIHGPIPDCWRFSEHGWKVLLKDFDAVRIDALKTPGRFLMPIHYNVSARCDKDKAMCARDIEFRVIT